MVEGLQVLGCYGKVAGSKSRLGPRLVNAVCVVQIRSCCQVWRLVPLDLIH